MNQEFFPNLPSEIIIDILSRLPVRTITRCKCVCKSWLDLLQTREFVKSHLSKSAPGLAVYQRETLLRALRPKLYKIYEFEDVLDLEHHELHYNPVTKFDPPFRAFMQGSANGLLFLRDLCLRPNGLYICNPITRDYIELHCPQEFACSYPQTVVYGFGASRMSGEHKVVRIFHDCMFDETTHKWVSIPKSECQVYTLGTGSWRSIAPGRSLLYDCHSTGACLNGKLHWLVFDLDVTHWISCFDLETESFTVFSPPPLPDHERLLADVFALGECLCVCDNSSNDEIVIWLMKEYGVEKSWTKEFVISKLPRLAGDSYEIVRPIKVFKDGDVLMAWQDVFLFYYCNKTKTIQDFDTTELSVRGVDTILHTSSFLSLKSFEMENVRSF